MVKHHLFQSNLRSHLYEIFENFVKIFKKKVKIFQKNSFSKWLATYKYILKIEWEKTTTKY